MVAETTRKALQEHLVALLADPEVDVRRALLKNMRDMCQVFGEQKVNDVVITHAISYLNEPDWQLRWCVF